MKRTIAIYADPIMGNGGGSRVTIDLANYLGADIITSGFNPKLRSRLNKQLKVIDIGNRSIKYNHPLGFLFEAPIRFILCKKYEYDVKIFIGNYSIFASRRHENNFWFCLTPNRIMYDLRSWKMQNSSGFRRFFLKLHILLFQGLDQKVVRENFIKIVAQTHTVKKRIVDYYKAKSTVIYSPVITRDYRFDKLGKYYMTVSRLVPEKRVDLIAKAFCEMPDEQLIIVGSGPESATIRRIIQDRPNITLLEGVSENKLRDLYAKCRAVLYFPLNEDFGLVPIEAMASGKICIASDEGGCQETILDGKTGYLIFANTTNIVSCVRKIRPDKLLKMSRTSIERAKDFDIQKITNLWISLIRYTTYV